MRYLLVALTILAIGSPSASAAVFQYTVSVATPKKPSAALLWIPPEANQVRGLLVAGMTLMEREFAKDAVVRNACEGEGLAILFFKCGLSEIDLPKVLDDLARISGYHELPAAPLMFVGHSAGGPQATSPGRTATPRTWRCSSARPRGPASPIGRSARSGRCSASPSIRRAAGSAI